MNCKLEKFWNWYQIWYLIIWMLMNCKLEKFWNVGWTINIGQGSKMNCKLEKFWNVYDTEHFFKTKVWTVNLKSFEMFMILNTFLRQKYEL